MTITITLLYPKGSDFNMDYYISSHMPLVQKCWQSSGLLDWRVSSLPGTDASGKEDWPYATQCVLTFEDGEKWKAASGGEHAKEVFGDIPNFSTKQPFVYTGELTGQMKA